MISHFARARHWRGGLHTIAVPHTAIAPTSSFFGALFPSAFHEVLILDRRPRAVQGDRQRRKPDRDDEDRTQEQLATATVVLILNTSFN